MDVIVILIGLLVLIAGRKLFWLFVGIAGFLGGLQFSTVFMVGQSQTMILVISVAVGITGALLAVVLQKISIILAGIVIGGYVAVTMANALGTLGTSQPWLPFVVGGVIGCLLCVIIFDWAMILLSSVAGAMIITQYAPVPDDLITVTLLGLFLFGLVSQTIHYKTSRKPIDRRSH